MEGRGKERGAYDRETGWEEDGKIVPPTAPLSQICGSVAGIDIVFIFLQLYESE